MIQTNKILNKNIDGVDKKVSGLVKKIDYNTKNAEIEVKIHNITGLLTTAALYTNVM